MTSETHFTESGQSPGAKTPERAGRRQALQSDRTTLRVTNEHKAGNNKLANNKPVPAASPSVALCLAPHAPDIPGVQPGRKLRGGR